MELTECIVSRRSIRKFEDREIEETVIHRLIRSAIEAPSACNMQAWKFVVVNEKELMHKLVSYGAAKWILKAPCGILVTYRNDVTINASLYKDHYQSAAAAIQNLLLETVNTGLAACWICDLPRPDYIRRIFDIPKNFDIIAYIALGYPMIDDSSLSVKHYENEKKYKAHERKYGFEQVVCFNAFRTVKDDCTTIYAKKQKRLKRLLLKRKWFQKVLFTDHMLKE